MSENVEENASEEDVILEPDQQTRVLRVEIRICNCAEPDLLDEDWVRQALRLTTLRHHATEIEVKMLVPPRNLPQGPGRKGEAT